MQINPGLDTGPMLLKYETEIAPDETAPQLAVRLSEAGAPLMVETLRKLAAGEIQPIPQDDSQASFAPILKKEDGLRRLVAHRAANLQSHSRPAALAGHIYQIPRQDVPYLGRAGANAYVRSGWNFADARQPTTRRLRRAHHSGARIRADGRPQARHRARIRQWRAPGSRRKIR